MDNSVNRFYYYRVKIKVFCSVSDFRIPDSGSGYWILVLPVGNCLDSAQIDGYTVTSSNSKIKTVRCSVFLFIRG